MSNYELRKLTSKDVFPMVNLIKKFGVDEFKKVINNIDIKKMLSENGELNGQQFSAIAGFNIIIDVVAVVVENLGKCEKDIFSFLASVSNLSENEIADLPMDEFAQLIIDVLSAKELSSFFGVVSKLLN